MGVTWRGAEHPWVLAGTSLTCTWGPGGCRDSSSVQTGGQSLENWGAVGLVRGCGTDFLLAPPNLAVPPGLQCKAIGRVEVPPQGVVGAGVAGRGWSPVRWGMLAAGL